MKQYVIDELRAMDYQKLKRHLDNQYGSAAVSGIYWIPLACEVLTEIQVAHSECQPFYFAIELDAQRMTCELLVRTQNRVRCSCMGYATDSQRNWFIRLVDDMFTQLKIRT
ncbi:MAG: hypothetical protein JSW39_03390 [Desulfobacterales bacterium]|nr:MAG: hypothetical protein JSW39_03390 [Desulfobacterales bacterium]